MFYIGHRSVRLDPLIVFETFCEWLEPRMPPEQGAKNGEVVPLR